MGSDVFGVNAFLGDLASVAVFRSALSEDTIQKLSAAKPISHTVLDGLFLLLQLRHGQATVFTATSTQVLASHVATGEELQQLRQEEEDVGAGGVCEA